MYKIQDYLQASKKDVLVNLFQVPEDRTRLFDLLRDKIYGDLAGKTSTFTETARGDCLAILDFIQIAENFFSQTQEEMKNSPIDNIIEEDMDALEQNQ